MFGCNFPNKKDNLNFKKLTFVIFSTIYNQDSTCVEIPCYQVFQVDSNGMWFINKKYCDEEKLHENYYGNLSTDSSLKVFNDFYDYTKVDVAYPKYNPEGSLHCYSKFVFIQVIDKQDSNFTSLFTDYLCPKEFKSCINLVDSIMQNEKGKNSSTVLLSDSIKTQIRTAFKKFSHNLPMPPPTVKSIIKFNLPIIKN